MGVLAWGSLGSLGGCFGFVGWVFQVVGYSAECVDAKSTRDPFGSLLRIYCIAKAHLFLSAITHDLESPNPSSDL